MSQGEANEPIYDVGSSSSKAWTATCLALRLMMDQQRLATNVSNYHDRMPSDAAGLVSATVWPVRRFTNSYAGASEVLLQRLREVAPERGATTGSRK